MNEGLALYLNLDKIEGDHEEYICRIDRFVYKYGIKYAGIMNFYLPANTEERDHAIFTACKNLRKAGWLKGILAHACIVNRTDVCPLNSILTGHMSEPSKKKMDYYEEYYKMTGRLPHPILVDESLRIRDGYISYLLAQKYKVSAQIMEALSHQPTCKVVCGRHVSISEKGAKIKNNKYYWWNYSLKKPIVPGDIVQADTKKGLAYICVERVENVTGREFCRENREVKSHMGIRRVIW